MRGVRASKEGENSVVLLISNCLPGIRLVGEEVDTDSENFAAFFLRDTGRMKRGSRTICCGAVGSKSAARVRGCLTKSDTGSQREVGGKLVNDMLICFDFLRIPPPRTSRSGTKIEN